MSSSEIIAPSLLIVNSFSVNEILIFDFEYFIALSNNIFIICSKSDVFNLILFFTFILVINFLSSRRGLKLSIVRFTNPAISVSFISCSLVKSVFVSNKSSEFGPHKLPVRVL